MDEEKFIKGAQHKERTKGREGSGVSCMLLVQAC